MGLAAWRLLRHEVGCAWALSVWSMASGKRSSALRSNAGGAQQPPCGGGARLGEQVVDGERLRVVAQHLERVALRGQVLLRLQHLRARPRTRAPVSAASGPLLLLAAATQPLATYQEHEQSWGHPLPLPQHVFLQDGEDRGGLAAVCSHGCGPGWGAGGALLTGAWLAPSR